MHALVWLPTLVIALSDFVKLVVLQVTSYCRWFDLSQPATSRFDRGQLPRLGLTKVKRYQQTV